MGLGAAGFLTFGVSLLLSPQAAQRAWAGLLLGNIFFLSLSLFGVIFVALMYIFNSGWAVIFRRVPEAMAAYLPFAALVMAVIFLGGRTYLYPWADALAMAENPHLHHKAAYLNAPFFMIRAVISFAVWIGFSRLLAYHSRLQDENGDLTHTLQNRKYAAIFLLMFGVTFLFSSVDWIMSLEPEWVSTIFPIYIFAGLLLGGFAALIILLIKFQENDLLSGVTHHHYYELARALCAASLFWAYIWFSQYMLIYYTNIPEESIYFARRFTGAGWWFSLLNLSLNWIVPQITLIPDRARRSPRHLLAVCGAVLLGRFIDLYLLIMPPIGQPIYSGLLGGIVFLGLLPLFILPLIHTYRSAKPIPERDPYLVESIHLHV
ncbi:MAG: hypothetical protein IT210_12940 [Armatimonadetes bacterium]|nr:hypothetical protein [Armatimonadota bacterium]